MACVGEGDLGRPPVLPAGRPDQQAPPLGAVDQPRQGGLLQPEVRVAVVTGRADRRRPLRWVEIGSVGGPVAEIPSAALRAARLQLIGSGQGSVDTAEILAELPALAGAIDRDELDVDAAAIPLADVERAWLDGVAAHRRLVITP